MAKLNFIHICEYAFLSQNGTPCIIGIFNRMLVKQAPFIRPSTGLVFEFEADREREYRIEIKCKSPSGRDAVETIERNLVSKDESKKNLGVIVMIQNLKLEEEGDYNFEIYTDGEKMGHISINFAIVK